MKPAPAEYSVVKKENASEIHIRKLNFDVSRYFPDVTVPEPITDEVLDKLIVEASVTEIPILKKEIGKDELVLIVGVSEEKLLNAFIEMFLSSLGKFYEENETHITRMFGSFVFIKRENGELRAVKATPVPIRYCPLMRQLLKEVGGKTAKSSSPPLSRATPRTRRI